jgi:glycosyltransferase involved in cell wall biosynthesis
LLVELARVRPDVDILVPWRQWGEVSHARAALEALRPPPNFEVCHAPVPDMRAFYDRSHAVLVPFAKGVGKACPNSVIEGFASGRPAIVTSDCGISGLVHASGAGLVAAREVSALSAAVDRLKAGLPAMAAAARHLAETHFALHVFRSTYERLYQELATVGFDSRVR